MYLISYLMKLVVKCGTWAIVTNIRLFDDFLSFLPKTDNWFRSKVHCDLFCTLWRASLLLITSDNLESFFLSQKWKLIPNYRPILIYLDTLWQIYFTSKNYFETWTGPKFRSVLGPARVLRPEPGPRPAPGSQSKARARQNNHRPGARAGLCSLDKSSTSNTIL